MDLATCPKVELHLHLDCSLSYRAVSTLDPSVTREVFNQEFIAPAKCANLADYLKRAPRGYKLMQSEAALELAVDDVFSQLASDHVIYAEIRFAPFLHLEKGLASEQVVEIVDGAVARAANRTGIEARIILCTLRHFSADQSLRTAMLVKQFMGRRVAAFDIAGDEAGFPIDAHQAAFDYAIRERLPRTAHAGEAAGAASVWQTLEHFQPSRLGHGVRSIEDGALVEHLREAKIHLEICPSCNVQIDIFPTLRDHAVDRLYRAGLSLGISTDTRTITDVTLTQEYERLQSVFGWTSAHFLACNRNAIRAAFAPPETKRRIEARLIESYTE